MFHALKSGNPVLVLFIFDSDILEKLEDKEDKRVVFIHRQLVRINNELRELGSSLLVKYGKPVEVWKELCNQYEVRNVFAAHDYEIYGRARDKQVQELLKENGVEFTTVKDIVILERNEVLKTDGTPYVVFTPYSRKWKEVLTPFHYKSYESEKYFDRFLKIQFQPIIDFAQIGFKDMSVDFPEPIVRDRIVTEYQQKRNFPALGATSKLGVHLRFGTLSPRKLLQYALPKSETFSNELIWRDFYHHILYHFPYTALSCFRKEYEKIEWLNDEEHFNSWCEGKTGYPLVDAGMRELNETGFMHNRVRMVVSSFLTKHLLIDWRWGEAYFAQKLLDFDLAANVGGWQWAAGCGTDAAPYFRIFNPTAQAEKFDKGNLYIKNWIAEYGTDLYPKPIVEHEFARKRCLDVYQHALKGI